MYIAQTRIRKIHSRRYYGYHHDKGVALVLVLWIIVLLSVIGISHSRNVRLDMQIARHHVESAKARALAESGVNRAIYELFNNNEETRWLFNGQVYQMSMPEGEVQIMIRNTAGLVDINTAAPDVLETLFSGVQIDQQERAALVDAIMDWKDSDDLKRLNGAEDADYEAEGLEYGTPDRPFFSIGELRYVLGMNTAVYNTISPYVTVFSEQSTINQTFAPEELTILFGGSEEVMLDRKSNEQIQDSFDNREQAQQPSNFEEGDTSNVYHISTWATVVSGAMAGLEVDVDTTQRSGDVYTILSWQESSQ
jgi:general secretion pathway protein K